MALTSWGSVGRNSRRADGAQIPTDNLQTFLGYHGFRKPTAKDLQALQRW